VGQTLKPHIVLYVPYFLKLLVGFPFSGNKEFFFILGGSVSQFLNKSGIQNWTSQVTKNPFDV